jgi:hypothetical protein
MQTRNTLFKINNILLALLLSFPLGAVVHASSFEHEKASSFKHPATTPTRASSQNTIMISFLSSSEDSFDEISPVKKRSKRRRYHTPPSLSLTRESSKSDDEDSGSFASSMDATSSSSPSANDENEPRDLNVPTTPISTPLKKQSALVFSPFTPRTQLDFKRNHVDSERYQDVVLALFHSPQSRPLSLPDTLPTIRSDKVREELLHKNFFCQQALIEAQQGIPLRSKVPSSLKVHGKKRPAIVLTHKVGIVEEPLEAKEERRARRKQQKELLQQVRKAQLASIKPDALSKEDDQIALYVSYLTLRKQKVDLHNKKATLIRKSEIEEIVDELFKEQGTLNQATYWRLEIAGYVVLIPTYFDYLTPDDLSGQNGLERMRQFLAPIGPDGNSCHLHHLTLYDHKTHKTVSYLILITQTAHQTYDAGLHFTEKDYWMPKEPVNRNLFTGGKKEIYPAVADHIEECLSQQ